MALDDHAPDDPAPDAAPDAAPAQTAGDQHRPGRARISGWNLLLALPIVLSLATFFYNRDEPRLFGFPAFYWLQLAFVIVGVASTTVVYQLTKDR